MKPHGMRLFIAVFSVCLCSCSDRRNDFTLEEFSRASGATFWKIKIPSDLKDDEYLATAWFRSDKFVQIQENLGVFAPGSVVKAFAFKEPKVRSIRFPLLGSDPSGGEIILMSIIEPLDGYYPHSFHAPGEVRTENDMLITTDREQISDDTCDLRLIRQKRVTRPADSIP